MSFKYVGVMVSSFVLADLTMADNFLDTKP